MEYIRTRRGIYDGGDPSYRHSRSSAGYGGSDMERQTFMGAKYTGPGSTDNDMASKFDNSPWNPAHWIEGAYLLTKLALVALAVTQLCRLYELSNGTWYALAIAMVSSSGLIAALTLVAVYKNGQERLKNVQRTADGSIRKEADGKYLWKDPNAVRSLPTIRHGFFFTTVMAGADFGAFWPIWRFYSDNVAKPYVCSVQRASDASMWIFLIVATFTSSETINYFMNYALYQIRKMMGSSAQIYMDL